MPNYCNYDMKIIGDIDNCKKWIEKLTDYDTENHFFRIFDASIYDEYKLYNQYCMFIQGDCAWSIESCCRSSGYSNGIDLFAVNTKDLHLDMEVFSEEPGVGFQEHYIYKNGVCILSECVDYTELFYDPDEWKSFEEYKSEIGVPDGVKEEDFDEDGYYCTGGLENWGEFCI